MSERTITRRAFVAGAAGAAAVAGCAGLSGCAAPTRSQAEVLDAHRASTLCAGCPNACGMTVWTRGGQVVRAAGAAGHPHAGGYLCGRGQGMLSAAGAEGRLTVPKMRSGDKLVDASWDEVLPQIAERLRAAGNGLAVYDSDGDAAFFAKRFAWSMGSANYFTDACLHGADMAAAQQAVLGGTATFEPERASYALLLAPTGEFAATPAQLAAFAAHRAAGQGTLVVAGPRLADAGRVADEWLAVAPGTELALLLGVAGELVRMGAYDHAFVKAHGEGFAAFADEVAGYSLKWAAERTGLEASRISAVASGLAGAAPAACVSLVGDALGGGSANGFDLCRMVLLVNALLGNVNHAGGMWVDGVAGPDAAALEAQGISRVEQPTGASAGADAAPLSGDSFAAALRSGGLKAAVVVGSNPAFDLPGASAAAEALQGLDCLVVMDRFMTETAELADFVLPLLDPLECTGLPFVVHGPRPMAAMRVAVADAGDTQAKSAAEAFCALGGACGHEAEFAMGVDDYARAWCAAAGVSYDGLRSHAFTETPGAAVAEGVAPVLGTVSGKVEFASAAAESAGLAKVPTWEDAEVEATPARPVLLVGQLASQRGSRTLQAPKLAAAAQADGQDCAWASVQTAKEHGIVDGATVRLGTAAGSVDVRVRVSERIHPNAVWLPVHFGSKAMAAGEAAGFGVAANDLLSLEVEQGTGAALLSGAAVDTMKAGA